MQKIALQSERFHFFVVKKNQRDFGGKKAKCHFLTQIYLLLRSQSKSLRVDKIIKNASQWCVILMQIESKIRVISIKGFIQNFV